MAFEVYQQKVILFFRNTKATLAAPKDSFYSDEKSETEYI